MDSTLLDQIRYLCRDRAAYERLKAILVQQERVHQLSWEERYEKLIATQTSDQNASQNASDIFRNIIAREKSLAQLADAIQRSPSLELILQIAVQVAQKLLQVDRVAIFRRYPDGRGEFATDAIATGVISLADMPERQLTLAKHIMESTDVEHSKQTIDSIRSSSLSSHIITLLEQIGISSYAVNKIYAGQEVWGTLVAFHGSAYHSWAESDLTSLSLVASQIGIAITLTNLRLQAQELSQDLEGLQQELSVLQQTVQAIAQQEVSTIVADNEVVLEPNFETPEEESILPKPVEVAQSLVEETENLAEAAEIAEINDVVASNVIEVAEITEKTELLTEVVEIAEIKDVVASTEVVEEIAESENVIEEIAEIADIVDPTQEIEHLAEVVTEIAKSENVIEEIAETGEVVEPTQEPEHLTKVVEASEEIEDAIEVTRVPEHEVAEVAEISEVGEEYEEVENTTISVAEEYEHEVIEIVENIEEVDNLVIEAAEITEVTEEIENITEVVEATEEIDNVTEVAEITEVIESTEDIENIEQSTIAIEEQESDSLNVEQAEQIFNDALDPVEQHLQDNPEQIIYSGYLPISNNGVPALFLLQTPMTESSEHEDEVEEASVEDIDPISTESVIVEINSDEGDREPIDRFNEAVQIASDINEVTEAIAHDTHELEDADKVVALETEAIADVADASEQIAEESEVTEAQAIAEIVPEVEEHQNSEVTTDIEQPEAEPSEAVAQTETAHLSNLVTDSDEERDPAIEPQFIETILAISGNDSKGIKFLLGVIDNYLEETPKLVQAIDKAIAINDHPRLLQLINSLRTSSDYVGALALSYQCRQLESAVRANYVVLIYACLSQVAIESQRATDALRIEREKYIE